VACVYHAGILNLSKKLLHDDVYTNTELFPKNAFDLKIFSAWSILVPHPEQNQMLSFLERCLA